MGKFLDPTGDVEGRHLGRLEAQDTTNLLGIEPRTLELLGECDTFLATPPISPPLMFDPLYGRALDWNVLRLGFESHSGVAEFNVYETSHVVYMRLIAQLKNRTLYIFG
ncbi:hypothetical protein OUZ56_025019 [Daphnia magna]|uniref:Uncharacterized protein n=1 Tax=Daphnia magna TaxID=35525 RepID=A0ABQ9ZJA2_9CRUS|nr:hypothetical protein OUZ56_025019 [Daphnia magna]